MSLSLGSTNIRDVLRAKDGGQIVDPHVVPVARDLTPDFDAMKKLLEPETTEKTVQIVTGEKP